MTTTTSAIYEDGVLKLPKALDLPEKSRVTVTIESETLKADSERLAWLQASKQKLAAVWENAEDDVFNELLDR